MDDTVEVAEVRTDTHTQLGKQPCCNAWRAGITYVVVSLYNYILEGWTPVNSISGGVHARTNCSWQNGKRNGAFCPRIKA